MVQLMVYIDKKEEEKIDWCLLNGLWEQTYETTNEKIDWCLTNGLWEQAYETTSGSPSKAIGTTRRPAISGGQNGYRRDER